MRLFSKHIFTTLTVLAMALTAHAEGPVTISASLDSTTLLMGNVTAIHVQVVQDKDAHGVMPVENMLSLIPDSVEIVRVTPANAVDIDNGRAQINRDIIIQAWDSATFVLPPIAYITIPPTADTPPDTVYSERLVLNVLPPEGVTASSEVAKYKPVESMHRKFFDWVPDIISDYWWAWLAALLLIIAAAIYYFNFYRKGKKNPFKAIKKRLPPYEEAMLNLKNLKEKQLWQNGQQKAYYSGLTDILRMYIGRRYDINAVEMTTTQLKSSLHDFDIDAGLRTSIIALFDNADFVKFARHQTLADENERAMQAAFDFVEGTKPLPEPEAEAQEGTAQEGGKK